MARPWFNVRPPGSAAALSNFDVNAVPTLASSSSAPLTSFTITAGGANGPAQTAGFDDGTGVRGPFVGAIGALTSGGGAGGSVLNCFENYVQHFGASNINFIYLCLTGPASAPLQTAFSSIAFIDAQTNAQLLTTASATYSTAGNQATWAWSAVPWANHNVYGQVLNTGAVYAVTVT